MSDRYYIVPAPGHYGDRSRVVSDHATVDEARRAARGQNVDIYLGTMRAGQEWLRCYESPADVAARVRTKVRP